MMRPGEGLWQFPVAICIAIGEFCINNDEFCINNDDLNTNNQADSHLVSFMHNEARAQEIYQSPAYIYT